MINSIIRHSRALQTIGFRILSLILTSRAFSESDLYPKVWLLSSSRHILNRHAGCLCLRGGSATIPSVENTLPAQTGQKAPFYPSVFDEEDTDSFAQKEDAATADRLLEKGSADSDEDKDKGTVTSCAVLSFK
jgi:hypothetical protein